MASQTIETTIHNANGSEIVVTGESGVSPYFRGGPWFDAVVDYPEDGWRKTKVVGGSRESAHAAIAIAYRWVLKNSDWLVSA